MEFELDRGLSFAVDLGFGQEVEWRNGKWGF